MALSAGCSRPGIETKEAERAGIIEHLTTRAGLDVKQMDVDVSNVSFRQGEADA